MWILFVCSSSSPRLVGFVYILQQFLSSLSLGRLHLLFVAASFLALARLSSLFFFAAASLFALARSSSFFLQQFLSSLLLGHLQICFATTFLLICSISMHISCSNYSCFDQLQQFFRLLHIFLLQFFYFGSDISISVCSNSACFYEHLLSFHLFVVMLV